MTYESAKQMIGKRETKKLANNTYLVRVGDHLAVKLHNTNIITFMENGNVVLNSGGWRTVTTKERLNRFLPNPWHVWQEKSIWYIVAGYHGTGYTRWVFEDCAVLLPNGHVKDADRYDPRKEKEDRKLMRDISKYAKDFMDDFSKGKVPAPDNGDCWDCLFREKSTNKTFGEISGSDHLLNHMRQKYYVPSLLVRAIEVMPVSIAAKQYVGGMWSGQADKVKFWEGHAKSLLAKALQRYMKRQLGFAA